MHKRKQRGPAASHQENTAINTDDGGSDKRTVLIRFIAQAWINDYAVTADPQGPTTFRAPVADAQDGAGRWLESHSDQSDVLHTNRNAPQWVQDWTGPFEIEIEHAPCPATQAVRVPAISGGQTARKGGRP
jgi:hypothetical protein